MSKSPLALVKEKFGDKAKLVEAVKQFTSDDLWVSRTNEEKGLDHVSNAKLLRLVNVFTQVKEQFGTRAKLIDAILNVEKRSKDDGYRARLTKFPVPRLFDLYKATSKRAKAATTVKEKKVKTAAPAKPAKVAAKPAKPGKAAPKKSAKK